MAVDNIARAMAASVSGSSKAADITLQDIGDYYNSDNVEGALQEIGAELAGINTLIGNGVIA